MALYNLTQKKVKASLASFYQELYSSESHFDKHVCYHFLNLQGPTESHLNSILFSDL